MNAIDHSIMVYLLEAVECAPAKARDLLTLAVMREDVTKEFAAIIAGLYGLLDDKDALIARCKEIREEIR